MLEKESNINTNNTITIKKVKDSWSKEEILQLTESAFAEGVNAGRLFKELPTPRVRYNKWLEQNL